MMEIEDRLEKMKKQIKALEADLDDMHLELMKAKAQLGAMREIQEVVAKIAGEPVGMLFTNYRA